MEQASALLAEGVPFQRLCNAFDQGHQTSHAQRSKAFYEQLSATDDAGVFKISQVCDHLCLASEMCTLHNILATFVFRSSSSILIWI